MSRSGNGIRGGHGPRRRVHLEYRPPGSHTDGLTRESHGSPGFRKQMGADPEQEVGVASMAGSGGSWFVGLCRPGSSTTPPLYGAGIAISVDVVVGTVVTGETGRSLYLLTQVGDSVSDPTVATAVYSHDGSFGAGTQQAFTFVERIENDCINQGNAELWRLDDPAAGDASAAVRVTRNAGTGAVGVFYAASATIRDFAAASSSTPAAGYSVTVASASADLVLALGGWLEANASPVDAPTVTGGATLEGTATENASFGIGDWGAAISSAIGATTMTGTFSTNRAWYAMALALEGSSTTGDTPQPVGANDEGSVGTSNRASRCDHVHAHSDLSDHSDETHHHASSVEFTPTGTIAASDTQAAVAEVASDAAAALAAHEGTAHGAIEVAEADGAPDVSGVTRIEFAAGTVTDDGSGQVTYTPPSGVSALDDLTDVDTTTTPPNPTDVLAYDGALWVPTPAGTPAAHASSHEDGGVDELEIADLATAETDTALVLHPDGAGGVAWGADATGGGSGGLTQAYVGKNAIGATTEAITIRRVYAKKITLANDCLITDIEAYVEQTVSDQIRTMSVILFSDNAGTPDMILSWGWGNVTELAMDNVTGTGGIARPRWLGRAIGRWVTAGDYWIAVGFTHQAVTAFSIYKDTGSGSDRYYTAGGNWITDWGFTAETITTDDYSIRANTIR